MRSMVKDGHPEAKKIKIQIETWEKKHRAKLPSKS